jgi:hypothetical protein
VQDFVAPASRRQFFQAQQAAKDAGETPALPKSPPNFLTLNGNLYE